MMWIKPCLLLLFVTLTISSNDGNKDDNLIRTKRGLEKIWGFFRTIREMKSLYDEQYNNTLASLNEAFDLLRNTFSDTVTTTPAPPAETNTTGSTTTEPYRISRYEFGRILGRNYRGLQKLYRLEMDDALNASQANIKEYQTELKNAIASFATFD